MSTIYATLKHPLINLTPSQQSILEIDDQSIKVIGLAGTGKTSTLIRKLECLYSLNRASGSNTLFVTPHDASSKQINKTLADRDLFELQAISFEELALNILRQAVESRVLVKDYLINYFQQGPPDELQILSTVVAEIKTKFKELDLSELNLTEILDQIKAWKSKLIYPESRWIQLSEELKEIASPLEHDNKTTELIFEYYENHLIKQKVLDSESLYPTALFLLYSFESLKQFYQNRLRHIFIDDFHQVSHLQFELLKPLLKGAKSVNLSLDNSQIIHPGLVQKLDAAFNFERFEMKKAFHYLSNNSQAPPEQFYPLILKEKANIFKNYKEEVEFIGEKINHLLSQGVSAEKIGVLVESATHIPLIETQLIKRKINYKLEGDIPFYLKNPFLSVLRSIRFAITDLKIENGIFPPTERQTNLYYDDLGVLNKTFRLGLTKPDFENIRKKTNWYSSSITRELEMRVKCNRPDQSGMLTFLSFITRLKAKLDLRPKEALTWIIKTHGQYFTASSTLSEGQRILQPLEDLSAAEITHCADYMDSIYELVRAYKVQRQSLFRKALTIVKIDQSRGRQWDYVFMTHPFQDLDLPKTNKLLYLGAGRAIKDLIFSSSFI